MKQYTIKATKGAQPILPHFMNQSASPKAKVVGSNRNLYADSSESVYERYISSMTFSKDDKYFALCLRNGPN